MSEPTPPGTNNEGGHAAPPPSPQQLRVDIDRAIGAGEWILAWGLLQRLWTASPDPATAGFINTRSEKVRDGAAGKLVLTSCRVAILRSFTVEPMVPLLRACAFSGGIDLTVHVGEFNMYAQEFLNPADRLYQFAPQIVVLAVQARDLVPELWSRFTDLSPEHVQQAIAACVDGYRVWIETFRRHSNAHLVIHLLETPSRASQGILDAQSPTGQGAAIASINQQIQALARQHRDVYVLDYNALVARHGAARWGNERQWLTVRLPIASDCLIHMAREWARFIHPLVGKVCKALVCDLDNTLWGGVIGEDGMTGIKLDGEYPGAAFQTLQRAIIDLYNRGVILAINSKNNEADAREAIEKHPGMVLKPEHFACVRANWQDKARNLREIAEELNIGIDSLCFIDDNPVERQWVREQVPEVTVIELPPDPMKYAEALRDCPVFERLSLSAEDKSRGRYYAEERLRTEFEKAAPNLEEFYWSLKMEAQIGLVDEMSLARVAQLTQKTNQFNLTTKRYSEQQVKEMSASQDWRVYWLRLKDRFGDNGLIGVGITHLTGNVVEVDTFLLSCRVIGRSIEHGFLSQMLFDAKKRGARRAVGFFIPTKKNAPSKDFLASANFSEVRRDGTGIRYEYDLEGPGLGWPAWVARAPGMGETPAGTIARAPADACGA